MTAPDPAPTIETLLARRAWVRGIARNLVADESRVDDVEQETWIAAMESPPSGAGSVGAWLRRVVRSRSVDAHRSESRRAAREAASARPEGTPSTDALVEQAEIQRDVAAAVCALEEPYRTAVLLRYFEELAPAEIASRLGVPVETVRTRLKRAHEKLRVRLDGEYGDRRAWCVLLVPLAKGKTAVPIGAAVGGAAVMAGTTKVLAAAAIAILLLAGGATWMATRGGSGDGAMSAAVDVEKPNAAPPAAPSPLAANIRVTGRVRTASDGRAVASALVVLEGEKGKRVGSAATAADGSFSADGLAARTARLEVAGFRVLAVELPPAVEGVADVGNLWLDAVSSLVVEVRGPAGAAVEGAEVTLVRTAQTGEVASTNSYLRSLADPDFRLVRLGAQTTDAGGRVRFREIEAGEHAFCVRAKGFAVASASSTVRAGGGETREIVELTPGVRLTGRLVTAAAAPAPGWLVWTGGATWDERSFATTDEAGRFAFDSLAPGEVQLSAGRKRGRLPILATVRVPEISTVELRLPLMGTVVGRVSLADGSPVERAEVGLETTIAGRQNAGFYAHTDADGWYCIDDVPSGPITRFEVRHAGLYPKGLEGAPAVDAHSETTRDVTMLPGARLHGRALSPDGPVGRAWVFVNYKSMRSGQGWETAVTGADGRYAFDSLRPGVAGVVPSHAGYMHPDAPTGQLWETLASGKLSAALTIDLPDGGDLELDLHMLPGTRIAGRVIGPAGEPVVGAVVGVDPTGYSKPFTSLAVTDENGSFVLERVAGPGTGTVRAGAKGLCQLGSVTVPLDPAGRVDDLEIRMAAQPIVAGRVLDAIGAPVAGARVVLEVADRTRRVPVVSVETDEAGAYRVVAPRADGRAVLTAAVEGRVVGRVEVDLAGDVTRVDIVTGSTCPVAVRVQFDDGQPAAGARVGVYDATMKRWYSHGDLVLGEYKSQTSGPGKTDGVADAQGRLALALERGEHLLVFTGDDAVEEAVVARAPSAGEVVVTMHRATTLSGTILGDDGKPLTHASVVLEPSPDLASERYAGRGVDPFETDCGEGLLAKHTDGEGAFAFPGIPEAEYALVVIVKDPASRRPRHVRFGPLRPSGGPYALSLAAPLSGFIAGRIVDRDGSPYRAAKLQVWAALEWLPSMWGAPMFAKTPILDAGADGTFRIDGLTGARYTVHVCVIPVLTRLPDGRVAQDESRRRSFRGVHPSATEIVLAMTDGLTIRGRVVDESGAPVANCSVEAAAPRFDHTIQPHAGRSDADGRFEIRDLDDVEYALRPNGGTSPQRRLVLPGLVRGGAELGDVVATLEGRVRGHVVDASGAPVPGTKDWKVSVVATTGGVVQDVVLDARGAFEATGLDPGKDYRVRFVTVATQSTSPLEAGVVVRVGTEDLTILAK